MPFDYKLQATKTIRNKARRQAKRDRLRARAVKNGATGCNDAHKAAKKVSRARRLHAKSLRPITKSDVVQN